MVIIPRPLYGPGQESGTHLWEAGWAPEPVYTAAENLVPHRESIPGPSSQLRVAIPNELSRPTTNKRKKQIPIMIVSDSHWEIKAKLSLEVHF